MSSRPIQKTLRSITWIGLLVGLSIPFLVSTSVANELRDLRCTEPTLTWTFAPLLFWCGEPPPLAIALGWLATTLTIGGLLTAVTLAAITVVISQRSSDAQDCQASLFATVTVAAVATVLLVVVALRPDDAWGSNAWVFFASTTGLAVLLCAGVVRAVRHIWRQPSPFEPS